MEDRGGNDVPASIPSGEQMVWADVSPLLAAACNDLHDGELIHGENFNLFAAMSALEIMDPKMDSGMERNGFHSIEEAIESGAAPIPLSLDRTVDVQRCIDVMDHLLSCETTWHRGHSLAQTVFSCIYLLRIERTATHPLLHSYCRIMRSTCDVVITAVSDARTHEEEDFFTTAYSLPLKGDGDEKCLSLLNSVEETVSRQLRACKAQASRKKLCDDIGSLQTNPDLEEGYCRAVLCRLRFRKHFYHALVCMRKPKGRGLELAKKHVMSCLSELGSMSKSVEFLRSNAGGPSDGEIECRTTASGKQPFGFDANINSRLSAPTPPRAIQLLSWKQAIEFFEKLLNDLDAIFSLPLDLSLENILQFLVQFQKSQPDLVARAHLQLLLVQDGKLYGKYPFHVVISRALVLPEGTSDQAFQENEFVVQLGQLTINLIKILCTNNAWQRRKLGKILQDWGVISIQLELAFRREFDETLKVSADEMLFTRLSKRLLVWAEEKTYWIASRFLLLGFQLELYSPKEYCMVYWYMYIIFVNLLEKMQMRASYPVDDSRRKGKKKRDIAKDVGLESGVCAMCMLLQCYIYISEGLTMMLAALHNERQNFKISSPFNSEHERFIQHFELLQRANVPPHISYHLFMESTTHVRISNVVKHNYFREVQRILASLRGSFAGDSNKLLELHQLEQVIEHNRIALSVIDQVGASDPSLEIRFEFQHHPFFPVAVVKRS
ncbi:N-alpha-acetyltransferase 35, NatC auxiliary subunit isoform X1 [Dendrobium catenatum]|uniref:N-alpha-acetyltransferase 35, NatC auxiliary subunit isoform X1 n=1 Tax=Dendrobium catenatum TaxID=906689 RepID=UPI0009F455F5|nr:N-alpha-acetyltransferase 35, NatC auxiliary subunit isoform X1 [Dendrobium catenatum]